MYACPGLLLLLRVIGGGQDVDWVNNVIKVVIFLIWKVFQRHKATITVAKTKSLPDFDPGQRMSQNVTPRQGCRIETQPDYA